jgi:ATP-dependent helicase/nuclease subunit A
MKKENAKKKAEALSPAQKRAVESFGKDVMVLAGAGSGKTRVLVERFFYAVSVKKIAPENILAITFTEKAANEMRKRLIEQCDGHGLSELRARIERAEIGTLHGFCGSILRDHPIEAGLDPFFSCHERR